MIKETKLFKKINSWYDGLLENKLFSNSLFIIFTCLFLFICSRFFNNLKIVDRVVNIVYLTGSLYLMGSTITFTSLYDNINVFQKTIINNLLDSIDKFIPIFLLSALFFFGMVQGLIQEEEFKCNAFILTEYHDCHIIGFSINCYPNVMEYITNIEDRYDKDTNFEYNMNINWMNETK